MTAGPDAEERFKSALAGRYTVERVIGQGGMATVYLARDLKNDRPVALKVLREGSPVGDAALRFQREIHVTAGLVHPHILPLLDSDTVQGFRYYAMPYVQGESLRDRLAREGRLPVEQAVQITCDVADALAHAHEHGLVHRDIKPGNILLGADHVFLADFGIVRPSDPTDPDLTQMSRSLGTPHYQSPEQWRGEGHLDGRSDLYSLGCVFFEMLTGGPPFRGPSAEAVGAKHLFEHPPPVSLLRPGVPKKLDRVVSRAMAKEPADRFATTSELAKALKGALEGSRFAGADWKGRRFHRWRRVAVPVVVAVGLAGLLWVLRDLVRSPTSPEALPDTTRYTVLAPAEGSGSSPDLDAAHRLNAALERWEGLTVAGPLRGDSVEAALAGAPGSAPALAELARSLGAGRIVRVSVGAVGQGFRVNGELLDATSAGELLESHSVFLPADLAGVDSAFADLADHLVFRGLLGTGVPSPGVTRSLAGRHAFLQGWAFLESGNLLEADSAFSKAVQADPHSAEAHLWIALARAWRGMEPPEWRASAERAAGSGSLSPRKRVMAEAVLAQGKGDFQRGCGLWEGLTEGDPQDFAGWLGLATCLEWDLLVLRDPNSPSGWRFRTSYHSAVQAYRRAFELFPPVLRSYREGAFSDLRDLLMTRTNQRRLGWSEDPDGTRFVAALAWEGDSLSLIPYPEASTGLQPSADSRAREVAVRRQRSLVRDLALGWASAYPRDPHAHEALAIALSTLGDPAALDRISRARALAGTAAEGLRLAGVEAWLRMAFALPDEFSEVRRARALTDSVLSGRPDALRGTDRIFLASLAALTGKAHRAAALMRGPGVAERIRVPGPLREVAPSLLIYAALGGPPDTLDALEARVRTHIEEDLLPGDRLSARQAWLARPATLAFFEHPMGAVTLLGPGVDFFLDFQAALEAHDTTAARQGMARLQEAREGLLPGSITMDALLSETELLVLLGEPRDAASWLDPALRALPQTVPWIMNDPVRAGALVRAFALRARIAHELGDREAAVAWRRVAGILWSDADPFLEARLSSLDGLFD